MDGDGIPLAFSTFPGNQNEQKSLKPLEQKILQDFGCQKFVYCSDAGLASNAIRTFNHMGERAFIVTYSPKYAGYQKSIREKQVDRTEKMLETGCAKKNRKNPTDPARFIGSVAVTKEGEKAGVHM